MMLRGIFAYETLLADYDSDGSAAFATHSLKTGRSGNGPLAAAVFSESHQTGAADRNTIPLLVATTKTALVILEKHPERLTGSLIRSRV